MAKCCEEAITIYVIATALGFRHEQHGDDFARRMIVDAGISLKRDRRIIDKLGEDARLMVAEFTRN